MDYKAIINLMKEMDRTELTKLEIEEEGVRICLEKTTPVIEAAQPAFIPSNINYSMPALNPASMMPMYSTAQASEAINISNQQATGEGTSPAEQNKAEDAGCTKIVSPMVGTYYASPSPDKPAFIKVGDRVKKGQTVCIIEAMKLMNEIESDQDGEIVKILVNNEQMVEFGQPLFLVK